MTTPTDPLTDLTSQVLDALSGVWDPELALDVVSLGLIYDVRTTETSVEVDMTLTTPGCPVSEQLPTEAADAIRAAVPPGVDVTVNVVWDPPWTPELLTPVALRRLGFPPGSGDVPDRPGSPG